MGETFICTDMHTCTLTATNQRHNYSQVIPTISTDSECLEIDCLIYCYQAEKWFLAPKEKEIS